MKLEIYMRVISKCLSCYSHNIPMIFRLICPNALLCCCVGEIMQIEENNNSILDANFTTVDTNYSYPLTMPSEIFQF